MVSRKNQVKFNMKANLIEQLKSMREVEKAARETFKVRAYTGIIQQLEAWPGPLNTMADVDAAGFKGVGKGIRGKMEQIFATGVIDKVEAQRTYMEAVKDLTSVHGIGPVRAKELIQDHGITSVVELIEHPELLNPVQVKGLRYHLDMQKRIPRKEMDKHFETLSKYIKGTFEVAGSYRRGAKDSGDIDVIICAESGDEMQNAINDLKAIGYMSETLASGPHKYMGVCKLPRHKTFRRIDIMWMEPPKYPFALLYFTGSKEFNVRVRFAAMKRGFSLNEYGLTVLAKGGKTVDDIPTNLKTERDVLDFLGVPFVAPENR